MWHVMWCESNISRIINIINVNIEQQLPLKDSNKNEHILVKMPFRTMKLRFEVNSQMNWNWKVQYGFEIEIPN